MLLDWIELTGYRRFEKTTRIYFRSRLVALTGPNESGKTSVLSAIARCTGSGAIEPPDFSRSDPEMSADAIIAAHFSFDDVDVAELSALPGGGRIRGVTVVRTRNNQRHYEFHPRNCVSDLDDNWRLLLSQLGTQAPQEWQRYLQKLLPLARERQLADSDVGTLVNLSAATQRAFKVDPSQPAIADAAEQHMREHVIRTVCDKIQSAIHHRLPPILAFHDAARSLADHYPFSDLDRAIPEGLANLLGVAKVDYAKLRQAVNSEFSRAETMIMRANEALAQAFRSTWSQSELSVRLHITTGELRIMVVSHDENFAISSRSAGLRQFVALTCFVMKPHATKPILLIDEVEAQLHYDAQADYIRILTSHRLVSQVIYTTHSYGALPDDLLHGVRILEAAENSTRVVNWIWTEAEPGLVGLLAGIGASSMAFVPMRSALFTEGASDMILLPLLLKVSTGLSSLPYQILQGISALQDQRVLQLQRQAPRVAFVLDGDGGGRKKRDEIVSAGVASGRVLMICIAGQVDATLEDLVEADAYVSAVNSVLAKRGSQATVRIQDLGDSRRAWRLENWCEANRIPCPDKRDVAIAIFNRHLQDGPDGLVAEAARSALVRLHEDIKNVICMRPAPG